MGRHRGYINERIEKTGAQIQMSTPAEHETFLKNEDKIYAKLMKQLKPRIISTRKNYSFV